MRTLTPAALDLILSFETGGQSGYKPQPEWPGGQSGLTIGVGYDLGYQTATGFTADWGSQLNEQISALLRPLVGKKAPSAEGEITAAVKSLRNKVSIPWETAVEIFNTVTVPRFVRQTEEAFPGSGNLPGDSFGALVSLVFNRGSDFGTEGQSSGERRREMRAIRDLITAGSQRWAEVVPQFAGQIRLWNQGKPTADNLPGRRLVEGSLFAAGLRNGGLLPPETLLNGDGTKTSPERRDQVKQMQLGLSRRGVKVGTDGSFGRQTMLAVWSWQRNNGMTATGVADPATLASL